jgi:ribose-phosphate pyrophosphokinase
MDFPLSNPLLLISGRSSAHLASTLITGLAARPVKTSLHIFADNEMQPLIHEPLYGETLFIIQATTSPESLMELFLLIDAAEGARAKHIIVVMPYFGYARQDRRFERSSCGAALIARLLETAGADELIIVDPHNPAQASFFRIPVQTLLPIQWFISAWEQQGLDLAKLVIVAPDVGSCKRALAYSRTIGAGEPAVVYKERTGTDQCRVWGLSGSVNGRPAMLVDDMISSGSTLLQAAKIVGEAGATAVYASATHLVSQQILPHLNQAPIDHLFITDSLPHQISHQKVTIVSLVPLLAEAIGRCQPHTKQPAPPFNYPPYIPSFIGPGKTLLAG